MEREYLARPDKTGGVPGYRGLEARCEEVLVRDEPSVCYGVAKGNSFVPAVKEIVANRAPDPVCAYNNVCLVRGPVREVDKQRTGACWGRYDRDTPFVEMCVLGVDDRYQCVQVDRPNAREDQSAVNEGNDGTYVFQFLYPLVRLHTRIEVR